MTSWIFKSSSSLMRRRSRTVLMLASSCLRNQLQLFLKSQSPINLLRVFSTSPEPFVSTYVKKCVVDGKLKQMIEESSKQKKMKMDEVKSYLGYEDGFPFEIVSYKPADLTTFSLTREFAGERIQVEVDMNENNWYSEDMDLTVTVFKNDGDHLIIYCSIYRNEEDVNIDKILFKSHHKESSSNEKFGYSLVLDEHYVKVFQKYLEERGIKKSMESFLRDYRAKNYEKKGYMWLQQIKDFMEK